MNPPQSTVRKPGDTQFPQAGFPNRGFNGGGGANSNVQNHIQKQGNS